MSTIWQSVENRCSICKEAVGKFRIQDGKIIRDEVFKNWGCWQHTAGTSKMTVLCRTCQKNKNKLERKQKKQQK